MDESVTMRDPQIEARVASSAYAQARAMLEAEPGDQRRRTWSSGCATHAPALAQPTRRPRADVRVPMPSDRREHRSGGGGLGAAAAEARERAPARTPDRRPPTDGWTCRTHPAACSSLGTQTWSARLLPARDGPVHHDPGAA